MTLMKRSGTSRRLRIMALSTSLGLLGTTAIAQDNGNDLGDGIRNEVGRQLGTGQGSVDPTQRGVGEAVRGVLQGQNAGDAIRRGVGEAARTATENPQQTLDRDRFNQFQQGQFQQGQFQQGQPQYDAQGRAVYDAQGRPLYDNQAYGNRGIQQGQVQQNQAFRPNYDAQQYDSQQFQAQGSVQTQQRAQLGISMRPESDGRGVQVQEVMRGSAAANAGLQSGDVIVSVAGQQVSDANQLATLIRQRSPGDQVELVVLRDGQRQTLNATLTAANQNRQSAARPNWEEDNQGLRQQVEQLQREVQDLRRQLQEANANRPAGEAGANVDAAGDINAGAGLNAGARAGAAGTTESTRSADGGLFDADANLDIDADAGADSDAGAAGLGAEAEAGDAGAAAGARAGGEAAGAAAGAAGSAGAEGAAGTR